MVIRRSEVSLPSRFAGHPAATGLLHEFSIRITPRGKAAKVLVFKNNSGMNKFWKGALGSFGIGRDTGALVTPLYSDCYFIDEDKERHVTLVDRGFFCVVGFRSDLLTEEVVAHEAVHVGTCHSETSRTKWPGQEDKDDERIAYPAGRFYSQTVRKLRALGLIK